MNIYLIGYRATGKTTIGRMLARRLNRRFIDSDVLIEETTGMPVSEIVSRFGWDDFRQKEKAAVEALCARDNLVVATGGGVVTDPQNTRNLRRTGTLIWLDASFETIRFRMNTDPQTSSRRPPLTAAGLSPEDEIRETLAQRRPLYHKAAHIHIPTNNQDTDALCDTIISLLP